MAGDRGVTDHSLEARVADLDAVADDAEYDTVLSCIGVMFATLKPYAPPPPPGASPAPLWGRADHVRALFGDWVTGLVARQQNLRVDRFATGAEFRDFFKINYGPTIAVYRAIADDTDKVEALDAELAALGDRHLAGGAMAWEYLLVTATCA